MKKLLFFAAALFAAVSFSACSDDDNFDAGSIVGTWKYVREVGYEISHGEREDYDETINHQMLYTFNENGSGKLSEYGSDDNTFTWSMSGGNQLTISFTDEIDRARTYTIVKLTSSEMQLFYHIKALDEHGREFEQKFTMYFTR
ncbi:lipocalin family protein [uncultured Alistipes sp.]|uniref:lipocalin family protein n=1 Tax=uncultured Alistipes sp. TaxID=538949 RepID=UPI002627FD6D|nr:lipocalin family protein [uncultured Alistipes sp.]